MILSISFKITAEIEIRKHKLMFCVLFRGGVVSTLYRIICSFIVFTLFFTVSNQISISLKFHPIASSHFFNRLSMATGSRGDVFVVRTSKPIETSEKSRYSFVSRFVAHSVDRKPRD